MFRSPAYVRWLGYSASPEILRWNPLQMRMSSAVGSDAIDRGSGQPVGAYPWSLCSFPRGVDLLSKKKED